MNTTPDIGLQRHPWLEKLVAEPGRAVDTLLRGVAHLPGIQKSSPSEAAMALLGDVPAGAAEWALLDQSLLHWLMARREADDALLSRPGGLERFIGETGEAIRIAWRLDLPNSCGWIRTELFGLLRWAEGFNLNATFDLARPLLVAAAHLQHGDELRFMWWRICEEAALPRLRHRLDSALLGLARASQQAAPGDCTPLLVGLAKWAGKLPADEHHRSEVVREWRSLKAAFPRLPGFWRDRWQAILQDGRVSSHPFARWLKEADPALNTVAKAVKRLPSLPPDIAGTIKGMQQEVRQHGLTEPLWRRMEALLTQIETYADATGESYNLVTSCTNIAGIILSHAPAQALALTRRALLWSPSHGHAWSIRAMALDLLNRPDLSEMVRWEAIRRAPSDQPLYVGLAVVLMARGRDEEAEALLRRAVANPGTAAVVELARLRWLRGDPEEALQLLRNVEGGRSDAVCSYVFCCLLIAEGLFDEARAVLQTYRHTFGDEAKSAMLADRIALGAEEMRRHLLESRQRSAEGGAPVQGAEAIIAEEEAEFPRLQKIGRVGQADLLFQLGGGHRDQALQLIGAALADEADMYAQVVKGLAVPEYRVTMIGRTGRYTGSLPVRLALTPPDVPKAHWQQLAESFPEYRHLTWLVQLCRGEADEEAVAMLRAWCDEPAHWDDNWNQHLKQTLASYLDGTLETMDLSGLVHDALTQAVDVGFDATPLAA